MEKPFIQPDTEPDISDELPRVPSPADTYGAHLAEDFIGKAGMQRLIDGARENERPRPLPRRYRDYR